MSERPKFDDYESTGQWMVATTLWARKEDYDLKLDIPGKEEVASAIDAANAGTALGEYLGAAWDAASEIVYDMFPAFREPDEESAEDYEQWPGNHPKKEPT